MISPPTSLSTLEEVGLATAGNRRPPGLSLASFKRRVAWLALSLWATLYAVQLQAWHGLPLGGGGKAWREGVLSRILTLAKPLSLSFCPAATHLAEACLGCSAVHCAWPCSSALFQSKVASRDIFL